MKPTMLAACLLPVLAVASMYGATPAQAVLNLDPVYVYENGECSMYDRDGNLFYGGATWSISEQKGSYSVSCKVKDAFAAGPSMKFAGFACDTDKGPAYKTAEQIDSKGNATLTCQVKLSDG